LRGTVEGEASRRDGQGVESEYDQSIIKKFKSRTEEGRIREREE
jgi:hypothetical protein